MAAHGPVAKVIAGYLHTVDPVQHGGAIEIPDETPRVGTGRAKFRRVRLVRAEDGGPTGSLLLGEPLVLEAEVEVTRRSSRPCWRSASTRSTACGS